MVVCKCRSVLWLHMQIGIVAAYADRYVTEVNIVTLSKHILRAP